MNPAMLEIALPGDDEKRQENILLFQDRQIRHAFMRKVFSIVISEIILTGIIVAPMILHQPTREMLIKNPGIHLVSALLFITVYFSIICCCQGATRSYPQNYIILFVLTVTMSVMVGCICTRFDPKLVLIAIVICFVLCTALYLFATQTTIDFTAAIGITIIFFIAFTVLVILSIFFPSNGLTWIILISGVVIMSIYFVVLIQLIMGGTHKYSLGPEDYVLAALLLYITIINIFLYILRILGRSNNN